MADDAVKVGMVRRMNVMHAVLRALEWSDRSTMYGNGSCPACHSDKLMGHRDVEAPHPGGPDPYMQPCPIAFALSEAAYEEPSADATTEKTFSDGSRFMRYRQWSGDKRPQFVAQVQREEATHLEEKA